MSTDFDNPRLPDELLKKINRVAPPESDLQDKGPVTVGQIFDLAEQLKAAGDETVDFESQVAKDSVELMVAASNSPYAPPIFVNTGAIIAIVTGNAPTDDQISFVLAQLVQGVLETGLPRRPRFVYANSRLMLAKVAKLQRENPVFLKILATTFPPSAGYFGGDVSPLQEWNSVADDEKPDEVIVDSDEV